LIEDAECKAAHLVAQAQGGSFGAQVCSTAAAAAATSKNCLIVTVDAAPGLHMEHNIMHQRIRAHAQQQQQQQQQQQREQAYYKRSSILEPPKAAIPLSTSPHYRKLLATVYSTFVFLLSGVVTLRVYACQPVCRPVSLCTAAALLPAVTRWTWLHAQWPQQQTPLYSNIRLCS
jgi:hypothetical protein